MADIENRQDGENSQSGRDGYKSNREGYNRYNRNDGGNSYQPRRPRFNSNQDGERPQRAYTPRHNNYNNEGGEQRQYRPRFNNNNGEGGYNRQPRQYGERSSYNPRFNNNNGEGGYNRPQRPYNNRYNNNNGEERQYRPRFNNNAEGQQEGGFRPRFNNNNGEDGYNRQGGYNRQNGGGYNNNRQGGYGNNRGGYGNRQQGGFRPRTADYNPNAKYSLKKQIEYKDVLTDPNEPIRLNKFLANAGICSRREADEYITAGVVSVNGEVVTELGTKVKRNDEVKFHDQPVNIERKVYVLLNKPKDCVTTSDDPQERKTVMDCVKDACKERIYPVGRLDRNTTGVLLLTNDGDLASKLSHPKFLKKKIYHVYCDKNVTKADLDQIVSGITLDDGEIHADAISYASDTDKSQVGIEIHSGKNRIVRRIFESLGYRVIKLDRVYFAGLTKKGLRRGDWRYLTEQEVNMLRMGSFE